MEDLVKENLESKPSQFTITNGATSDFELLPKDLSMPPRLAATSNDDIRIELGPLEFDYTQVKQEVSDGKSKLRLVKDDRGTVLGFTIISPGEPSSTIKMLWVNPQYRKAKLGEELLQDAIQSLPEGTISMDIWGGEPMTKLATKFGFSQIPGGNMTNRYSFQKKV